MTSEESGKILPFPKKEEPKEQLKMVYQCNDCGCQLWYISEEGYECSECGVEGDMEWNKQ